jgi:ribbon-helix-helix CopG family protein
MGSTQTKARLVHGAATEASVRPLRATTPGTARRVPPRQAEGRGTRLLVYVPDDTVRWLRHRAVDERRSVSDIVRDVLKAYRAEHDV